MEVFNGFLFENKILLWLLARPLKVAFCGEYVAKNHQKTNARKQHRKNRQKGACYSNRKKHELNQSDSHLPRVLCQKISADNLLVIFFH